MALPARISDKDSGLQEVLARLEAARGPVAAGADPIVTALERIPAVAAEYGAFPEAFDPRLLAALSARGIARPYTHQAEAIALTLAGRNVVVITPTASGKTLCYNAPILDAVLRDPSARALCLFPTKALAQDQLAELQGLAERLAEQAQAEINVLDRKSVV